MTSRLGPEKDVYDCSDHYFSKIDGIVNHDKDDPHERNIPELRQRN